MSDLINRADEWCTDCKEYDHEKHCCPRFNRVIRETLEEAIQNVGVDRCRWYETCPMAEIAEEWAEWATVNGEVRRVNEKDLLIQQLRQKVAELEAELNESIPRDAAAKIVDSIDTFTMGWRDYAVAQIMAFTREEDE